MTTPEAAVAEIHLIGVPIEKWARWHSHHDTIRRELEVLLTSRRVDLPVERMTTYVDVLGRRVGDFYAPVMEDLRGALHRQQASVNVRTQVHPGTATEARNLDSLLDEINDFCRDEESLITVATPLDLVSFRSWFLGEFVRQVQGAPPGSWLEHSRKVGSPSGHEVVEGTNSGGGSGGEATVTFSGELDLASAAELQMALQDARRTGAGSLRLDMTGVTFIDSVGLSLLVTVRNRVVEEGGRMNVVLPARLRSLFDLSGLLEILEVEFVGG